MVAACESCTVAPARRWVMDTDVGLGQGNHLYVAIIASVGLSVWSVGVVVLLFCWVYTRRRHLQEFTTKRMLGYFYNGLEADKYWWELVVKRVDLLLIYLITYTQILH